MEGLAYSLNLRDLPLKTVDGSFQPIRVNAKKDSCHGYLKIWHLFLNEYE